MNPEKITEELIRYRTITGISEEIEKGLKFIRSLFGSEFEVEEFENEGVKSLLISHQKTQDVDFLLHGHLDVVSAEKELFEPRTQDGRLYGRGSADMKSGLACLMKVLKELDVEGLALLVTSDEEKGGFNGTGYVIEESDIDPDLVISAEPDDSGSFPSIVTKQKGVFQVKASVTGESAHASKPEKGVNAAEKLIDIYREEIRPLFDHTYEFSTTVNLGKFESGDVMNRVPNSAEIYLDIRYSDQYPKDEVLEDLSDIEGLDVEVTAEAPMMKTSEKNGIVQQLADSIEEVSGVKPGFRSEAFASDMRFFTEKEVPAVCFGPEGYNLHSRDEYVEIGSMEDYCEMLKNFLESSLDRRPEKL